MHLIEAKLLDPVSCPPPPYYEYYHNIKPHVASSETGQPTTSPQPPDLNAGNLFSPKPPGSPHQREVQQEFYYPDNRQQSDPPDTNANYLDSTDSASNIQSSGNVRDRLDVLATHMSKIDSKLSNLAQQLDTNTLTAGTTGAAGQDELMAAASENYRFDIVGARRQSLFKVSLSLSNIALPSPITYWWIIWNFKDVFIN